MNAYRRITRVVLLGALLAFALGAPAAWGATLADSYPETNSEVIVAVNVGYPQVGQSFTAVRGTLDSVAFMLSRSSASMGNAYALLYAHSATFGVSGVPSGPPLATSSPVDVTTINYPTAQPLITFNFDNTVLLAEGEKYVIVVKYEGAVADSLWFGLDNSAPTHPGNFSYFDGSTWIPVVTYDGSFYVYETPPLLVPVYRFYNAGNGTHFYTDSEAEKAHVIATWPTIYQLEGPVYYTYPANNKQVLHRLYNKMSKSHFYTSSATERDYAVATWPHIFSYDGPTYAVNPAEVPNSIAVYRFYNIKNSSHFYTSDLAERDSVYANLSHIYQYEGPAFWVGQ